MSAFCLVRDQADRFIKGLRSGEIDPVKMAEMTSEKRNEYLAKFVDKENATQVNALFESKLLLKNQKTGFITWAKKVAGLTPESRKDLITKIGKMDSILNPEEEKTFLHDLASTKLGADVTAQEAKQIFELSNKVKEAGKDIGKDFTFKTEKERLAYGEARVDLANYVNDLKGNNKTTFKSLADVGGITKSLRASLDDSAIFRQGWKTMLTHPATWLKNGLRTFSDIVKSLSGKEVMDQIMADRESRPNELNGNYKKMGLAVNRAEEAFPSSLPEKLTQVGKGNRFTNTIAKPIQLVGRAYKASENAYTGFVYRQRMDIADKYLKIAQDNGTDLTPKELKSIGSMVNSLTGRGDAGFLNEPAINNIFFSPRYLKSQIDTLGHVLTGAGGSNFVRKEAAINLVKIVSGIATIMTVANALKPGSAETDSRSADFGKIRIGNTRFDITGGISSLITLASRIATQSSKSSTTGQVSPINSGKYGSQTGKDVVTDYLTNKLSPIGQVVLDMLNQKDRNGKPITVVGELENLGLPLSVATYKELKSDPRAADILVSMILDGSGIATNTYGQTQKNWGNNPTKAQLAFQQKVGNDKFNQANDQFNKQYDDWFAQIKTNSAYKNLDDTQKQNVNNAKKDALETQIFKSYGFTYKEPKQSKVTTQQKKATIKRLIK